MIALWLERLALLGALSALVLALFWPHVGPKLLFIIQRFLINPISALVLSHKIIITDEHSRKQNIIKDHPKFSGGSLRRMTSDKESIFSAYRSLEGFGQSPLAGNPSFALPIARTIPSSSHGLGQHRSSQAGGGQSSMAFTVFTATMLALVAYVLIKMLTSRFACNNPQRDWRAHASCLASPNNYSSGVYNRETRDIRQDRRRFARSNRDERARELILHHGGRNVCAAIRFLVGELEKQKRLLLKNLSNNNHGTCNCSCHTDDACQLPSPFKQKSLDKSSASLVEQDRRKEQLMASYENQQETTTIIKPS